jgi:hypothetical protein
VALSICLVAPSAFIIAVGDKKDVSVDFWHWHDIAAQDRRDFFQRRHCVVGHPKDACLLAFELVLNDQMVIDVFDFAYWHVSSLTLLLH